MTTQTTTDRAAEIRAAYKAKGWTSRDISVKASYYSMGSSITVTIKNADVPLAVVEQIANAHENIHRCQITGDILSGGNRYVHVGYSREAAEVLTARYLPTVEAAAVELNAASENALIPIGETAHMLGRSSHGHGFSLWNHSGHITAAYDTRYIAERLAIELQK